MSSMQMMAPFTHSPAHAVQASQFSDPPTSSQENAQNGAQWKKNRWTDAEEKILIELFGENEDKLRYRSFNSPEWQFIARQLQERCRQENVENEKSAQQFKNKMANLTKKYKTVKDKLRTTGYGKGGDDEHEHKETESGAELIPRNFHDMDDILGNREAVNPKHVLESSSQHVDSSPEIDQDLLETETLDRRCGQLLAPKRRGIRLARLALMALKKRTQIWLSRNHCSSRTKAEKGRARARAHPIQRVAR